MYPNSTTALLLLAASLPSTLSLHLPRRHLSTQTLSLTTTAFIYPSSSSSSDTPLTDPRPSAYPTQSHISLAPSRVHTLTRVTTYTSFSTEWLTAIETKSVEGSSSRNEVRVTTVTFYPSTTPTPTSSPSSSKTLHVSSRSSSSIKPTTSEAAPILPPTISHYAPFANGATTPPPPPPPPASTPLPTAGVNPINGLPAPFSAPRPSSSITKKQEEEEQEEEEEEEQGVVITPLTSTIIDGEATYVPIPISIPTSASTAHASASPPTTTETTREKESVIPPKESAARALLSGLAALQTEF